MLGVKTQPKCFDLLKSGQIPENLGKNIAHRRLISKNGAERLQKNT